MLEFVIGRAAGPKGWLVVFVPGVVLMALGVLIWVWPDVLVALVAGILLSVGAALAGLGWRLRQGLKVTRPGFGDLFGR